MIVTEIVLKQYKQGNLKKGDGQFQANVRAV